MILPNLHESSLAPTERNSLDYFQHCLWPRFFTTTEEPCQPPICLALMSNSVRQVICVFADIHRIMRSSSCGIGGGEHLQRKRLDCVSAVRQAVRQCLTQTPSDTNTGIQGFDNDSDCYRTLDCLLVAVLLIYFLDGFIDCTGYLTPIFSHRTGIKAILDHTGGLENLLCTAPDDQKVLLSEFASSDLTYAMCHGLLPLFSSSNIWEQLDQGPVWWDRPKHAAYSLAAVFGTITDMLVYQHERTTNAFDEGQEGERLPLDVDRVQEFEARLQIKSSMYEYGRGPRSGISLETPRQAQFQLDDVNDHEIPMAEMSRVANADALCQAFHFSALIYLYRVICGLPPRHRLVQTNVQLGLACIGAISDEAKAQNCAIFPLYIIGAHTFVDNSRQLVLERLQSIYGTLQFQSVVSVISALEALWGSPRQDGPWDKVSAQLNPSALIL